MGRTIACAGSYQYVIGRTQIFEGIFNNWDLKGLCWRTSKNCSCLQIDNQLFIFQWDLNVRQIIKAVLFHLSQKMWWQTWRQSFTVGTCTKAIFGNTTHYALTRLVPKWSDSTTLKGVLMMVAQILLGFLTTVSQLNKGLTLQLTISMSR